MKLKDIVIGKQYFVIEDEDWYLREGAIVEAIAIDDSGHPQNVKVEDNSKMKYMDGIWWIPSYKLAEITEGVK